MAVPRFNAKNLSEDQLRRMLASTEILAADDIGVSSLLMAAAPLVRNAKARTLITAGAIAYSAGGFGWKKYKEYRNRNTFMIKIYQTDAMYDVIQKWLISSLSEAEQKNVVAFSSRSRNRYESPYGTSTNGSVDIAYDGTRVQIIEIDGHEVSIQISEETQGKRGGRNREIGGSSYQTTQQCLQIECPNIAARRAVLARLRTEAESMNVSTPKFRTAQRWGDFATVSDIPVRPIETVILKAGQAERVIADLKTFLTQEEAYVRLGVPYRRGLLLEGPPGTGKTSLASAITHELGLDVYYISLSALESDSTLGELLSNIDSRSVLLLEDVDCVSAAHDRAADDNDDDKGVTTAGLLNALDGFNTPHGMITIMTTNHIEVLDEALIRPGRVDMIETISSLDHDQLERMCKQYIGHIPDGLPTIQESDGVMPSEIIAVFKKTIASDDQNAVGRLLVDVLNDRQNKKISIADSLIIHDFDSELSNAQI